MSQKKARAKRKATGASHPLDIPKDARQPIKLDSVTAEDGLRLLTATLNRALESQEMQMVMRNILKGRRMVLNSIGKSEPDLPWGWRLKNFNIGELWLVPLRDDELKDEAAPTPTNFHPDDTTPSANDESPKANGHAEKAKAEAAKVVAKDSA